MHLSVWAAPVGNNFDDPELQQPGIGMQSVIPEMAQPLSGIHGKERGDVWTPDIRSTDSGVTMLAHCWRYNVGAA